MSNLLKRGLSLLMVLCMVLALVPGMATAADGGETVYLQPGPWNVDGARFAARWWNDSGEVWLDMTDPDGDGTYECTQPNGMTNVIFCRMNGSTTENNWDNKWNQSADLEFSASAGNCYTVTGWSSGDGSWGTYTPPVMKDVYVDVSAAGWTNVNVYFWGAGSANWPGNAMEHVSGSIWKAQVNEGITGIIFNNGSTQTADLTPFENGGDLFTLASTSGDGKWTGTWSTYGYTVTFADEDGTVLQTGTVKPGVVPTAPADPTKAQDGCTAYTFAGWDKEIVAVTGDATYTATYTSTVSHSYADGTCTVCGEADPNYSESYVLVTDPSVLTVGDAIVIVAADSDFALSTNQKNNNRDQASVVKNADGTVTLGSDVQVITLEAGTTSDTYAFNVGNGYLYAASSSANYLRTETTLSANSSWKITVDTNGVASIVAQGTNTRNVMRYNQSSGLFACYKSGQKDVCIYVLRSGSGGGDTHEHSYETVVTPATCTEDGYTTYTCSCGHSYTDDVTEATGHNYVNGVCSACGDRVADYSGRYYIATIRSSGNYWYMTNDLGTASTKRYQAVDTNLTTLPTEIASPEADKIFVLEKNADGTYSIYAEGVEDDAKYLGWSSGNSGKLVAAADALELTVDYNEGVYNIHFTGDAERYLALNGTTGNDYFAWYKGERKDLTLIPVTGEIVQHTHTPAYVAGKDATCTEDGNIAYWCCSDETCPNYGTCYEDEALTKVVTSDVVLPATGHSYNNGKCACGDTQIVTLKGSFDGWTDGYNMVWGENGVYTYTIDHWDAAEYKFKIKIGDDWYGNNGTFTDSTNGQWSMSTSDGDCTLKASGGSYTFSFDITTNMLTVTAELDHVHDLGEPEYDWSDYYTLCMARFTCQDTSCGQTFSYGMDVVFETVDGKLKATASCTVEGETVTTAQTIDPVFTNAVYFDNSSTNWTQVYAYCWGGNGAMNGWPGTQMTKVEGYDELYVIIVPDEYDNIIFTNDKGAQTVDLTIPTSGQNVAVCHTNIIVENKYQCSWGYVEPSKHTITWNACGKTETTTVYYGATPVCPFDTLDYKNGCAAFTFSKWDQDIVAVTGDAIYTAQYTRSNSHTSNEFNYTSLGNDTHSKSYKCCGADAGVEDCSGGTAWCNIYAVCQHCENSYGSLNASNHTGGGYYEYETESTHRFYHSCCGTYGESVDCSDRDSDNDHLCDDCFNPDITSCVSDAVYTCQSGKCVECGQDVEAVRDHDTDQDCDKICSICGDEIWPWNDHARVNDCDTRCQYCGEEIWPDAKCESNADYYCQDGNCIWCGKPVAATEKHEWVGPDCVNNGYCSNCGTDGEPALGHGKVEGFGYNPNDDGTHWKWCLDCTETINEAEGCTYGDDHVCDYCEATELVTVIFMNGENEFYTAMVEYGDKLNLYGFSGPAPADGQHLSGWFTADGESILDITITGYTVVYAKWHTMTYVAAKAATCAATGNIAHYFCEDCSRYFEAEKTDGYYIITSKDAVTVAIDENAHDYSESTGWYVVGDDHYYGTVKVCKHDESHVEYAPVTGITRVPYPAEPINGITYGPNPEDLANADKYGYTDATSSLFVFGEDGKFDQSTGVIHNEDNSVVLHYAINGQLPWHIGFVQVGSHMYYFIGANEKAVGDTYVSRAVNVSGFAMNGVYTFGEDGNLCRYKGITKMADGTLRYYSNYRLMMGAGLVQVDDNYIYVRSSGELVVNAEYYVPANELGVPKGIYYFDADGFLVMPEEEPGKNGFYFEDGAWYYYVDGAKAYCAGLICTTGINWYETADAEGVENQGWVYVKSNGALATGEYYVTNVNGHEAIASGDKCVFGDDCLMQIAKNGIIDGYYYENNQIAYAAGLVEVDGNYYYVRSNGQIVVGRSYWITNVNDTGVVQGWYEFDENGIMLNPETEVKNGVVDGYYYEDGKIAYAAGLIEIESGKFIYVRSNGQLATGIYWTTNHNGALAEGLYDFGEDGILVIE